MKFSHRTNIVSRGTAGPSRPQKHSQSETAAESGYSTSRSKRSGNNSRNRPATVLNSIFLASILSTLNPSFAVDTDHMFCGSSWGDASNNCDERQHCPGATDDECETEGHICFGGTSCDSKLGHGNKFKYANVPYDDISNTRFCGSGWNDAIENCSLETHCPSGFSEECTGGMSCYGGLSCNVKDMMEELDASEGGGENSANKIGKHDERRSQFCGISWGDANSKCEQWCPSGEGAFTFTQETHLIATWE